MSDSCVRGCKCPKCLVPKDEDSGVKLEVIEPVLFQNIKNLQDDRNSGHISQDQYRQSFFEMFGVYPSDDIGSTNDY